jgi:hypothetical protein
VHEVNTNQVVLQITLSASPNTIPLLFLSETNWSSTTPLSDHLNQHPCEEGPYANSICCVNKIIEDYQVPPSMQSLYENPSVCPRGSDGAWAVNYTGASSENTELDSHLKIGDLARMDFVSTGPYNSSENDGGVSYEVVAESDGMYTVELRMNHLYLKPRSRETVVGESYRGDRKYEFYVGVTFLTLSDSSPLVAINSAQASYEYFKSEFIFMSISTEQENTPVKQLDVVIHQGKSVNNNKLYQYIELDIEYENGRYPGAAEIQHDSLRWVKHSAIATANSSEWTYPCREDTGYYYTGDRLALDALAEQDCLPTEPTFCMFNAEDTFYMPFPEEYATQSSGYLSGADSHNNLYLQFVLRITDEDGSKHLSTIFSSVNLQSYPVLSHCEDEVFYYNDVTDALKITATMGVQDVNSSSSVLSQTTSGNRNINEISANPRPSDSADAGAQAAAEYKGASSYAEATIAVEIDAVEFMDHVYAGTYSYRIDNMLIFNFLGESNSDYEAITAQIRGGGGFEVAKEGTDAFYTLSPNFGPGVLCEEVADMDGLDSTQLQCFWRRAIVANEVQPVAAESLYFYREDEDSSRDGAKRWIAETVLGGGSAFDTATASDYFERTCSRNQEDVTETRSYGCLFVDPGYRWISRAKGLGPNSPFTISDKTVVVAIVTIATGDGTVLRRRLLSADASSGAVHGVDVDAGAQPARHLLAEETPVNKAARVANSQGSSAFVCKHDDVDPHLSMFYMAGYGAVKAQQLEIDAFHKPGGDLRNYATNVQGVMGLLGPRLGTHARAMRATGFRVKPAAAAAGTRRLLASSGVAAKAYSAMSISAIIDTGDNFGEIVIDELQCALGALEDEDTALSARAIELLVAKCERGSMPAPMRSAVQMRLALCVDSQEYVADVKECNQIRAVMAVLSRPPPVNTKSLALETPQLAFTLPLSIPLADATADSSVSDMIRQRVAKVLSVGVERVLVQFGGTRTLRRLLAADTTASVFVYRDPRAEYAGSPVNNGFAGEAWADLRLQLEATLHLVPAIGFAAGASMGVANTSPSEGPTLPGTSKWAAHITCKIAGDPLSMEDVSLVVQSMGDALREDMALLPMAPAEGDVASRSMRTFAESTTILVWVRMPTEEDAAALTAVLRVAPDTLRSPLVGRFQLSDTRRVRSIRLSDVSITVDSGVVSAHDRTTLFVDDTYARAEEGLPGWAVFLIVLAVLFACMVCAAAGNWYNGQWDSSGEDMIKTASGGHAHEQATLLTHVTMF